MLDADIGSFQSLEINWPQTVKTVNQHFKIYKQFIKFIKGQIENDKQ